MRFAVFAFLIVFLIALAVPASALDGWSYYRSITITNGLSQDLTDYQVNFTLDTANLISQGKMRSDCGDLRVTQSDGQTLLPYWIDPSTCNTNKTMIWTKVPSIPASSSITIYVWYGNSSAVSAADGVATFVFFDDFLTADTTMWNFSAVSYSVNNGILTVTGGAANSLNPIVYKLSPFTDLRIVSKQYGSGTNPTISIFMRKANATATDRTNAYIFAHEGTPTKYIEIDKYTTSGTVLKNVTTTYTPTSWEIIEAKVVGSTLSVNVYFANYSLVGNVSVSDTSFTSGYVGINAWYNDKTEYIDWVFATKIVSLEPNVSVGNELIGKPDLTIISADYSPKPASVQQQVNISAQIANMGNWTSPIANVTLYINGNAVQTAQISGLNPNANTTVTFAWMPTAAGNYTATIVVDPNNLIDEVNENNNTYNLTVGVTKIADLTVNVSLPASSMVDEDVAFSVVVVNIGSATAYNFSIVIYIDTNKFDEKRIASLDPNGQILLEYLFTPHVVRNYTITVVADPENNVIESTENNNAVNATIKILAFGDIVKIPTPPKPEGKSMKEIYEDLTLKTYNLPLEVLSLIALLSVAVIGYGFGAFKGTINLFFLSVLYYIAANALGWNTYISTGLLVVSAILLVIVVAFLRED